MFETQGEENSIWVWPCDPEHSQKEYNGDREHIGVRGGCRDLPKPTLQTNTVTSPMEEQPKIPVINQREREREIVEEWFTGDSNPIAWLCCRLPNGLLHFPLSFAPHVCECVFMCVFYHLLALITAVFGEILIHSLLIPLPPFVSLSLKLLIPLDTWDGEWLKYDNER